MLFSVSGVEIHPLVPPLVAFGVSFVTSMGGVSGAFLLLPFQMSVLGYTAPSVSATNHMYNILAIPGGVWRFVREKRMLWPLAWAVILGTLPGVFLGAWVRIRFLPDPARFKFFVGLVLLYIGLRMLVDVTRRGGAKAQARNGPGSLAVSQSRFSWRLISFEYDGRTHGVSSPKVFVLCFVVGVIGGAYGIGGGSIIAPFLVSVFGLPVHVVAGAALMGTFVTSVAGVVFFKTLAVFHPHMSVAPDLTLGALFGLGGAAGIYLGARCQKYVSARIIKAVLCASLLFVAGRYVLGFFI